ncbi:MAG: hypothetical protein U0S48_11545 [Solirubrobacteraceae bacterium]
MRAERLGHPRGQMLHLAEQPRRVAGVAVGLVAPHDEGDVVAVEVVGQPPARLGHVDPRALEQRADLGGAHGRGAAHPLLALAHVELGQVVLEGLDPREQPVAEEPERVDEVVLVGGPRVQPLEPVARQGRLPDPVRSAQQLERQGATDVLLRVGQRLGRRLRARRRRPLAQQRDDQPQVRAHALQRPHVDVVVELGDPLVDHVGQRPRELVELRAHRLDDLVDLVTPVVGRRDGRRAHTSSSARSASRPKAATRIGDGQRTAGARRLWGGHNGRAGSATHVPMSAVPRSGRSAR